MSSGNIARKNERVNYYLWNSLQGIAIFASCGGSGLYWSYLMTQSTGSDLASFTGIWVLLHKGTKRDIGFHDYPFVV